MKTEWKMEAWYKLVGHIIDQGWNVRFDRIYNSNKTWNCYISKGDYMFHTAHNTQEEAFHYIYYNHIAELTDAY